MRAFLVLALLSAAFILPGCNPADNETETGKETPAVEKTSETSAQNKPEPAPPAKEIVSPAEWPSFMPAYPGGDLQSAELVENEFGRGIQAELHSGASLDEIDEYYQGKMDEAGFYLIEQTISPIERFRRYIAPGYAIQVAAIHESDPTRILLDAVPVEELDEELPPLKTTWLNLGELPPGYPEDLLPLHKMTKINSGVISEDGKLAVADFTVDATVDEMAKHYSDFYEGLGWRKDQRSISDTSNNIFFFKGGMQITVGVGLYGDGNVYVSLSYMPEAVE